MIRIPINKKLKITLLLLIISLMTFLSYTYYIANKYEISDVSIVGDINYADGLGRQSSDLLNMLENSNITTNFIKAGKIVKDDIQPNVLRIVEKNDRSIGKVLIFEKMLKITPGDVFKRLLYSSYLSWIKGFPREKQIWHTYSMIESTKIPEIWVDKINDYFDSVIVPDDFLVEVYKNSGVKKPVFVVPLSVDMDHLLKQELKSSRNKIFTYINLGAINSRKNQIALVKAFSNSFKNREDVKLILNARVFKEKYYNEMLTYIKQNNIKNIEINIKKLNKEEYTSLLKSADCYINVSVGEGFSVQPREAMALGIPTAISNNTAHKTIVKSGLVEPIKSEIRKPSYNTFLKMFLGDEFYSTEEEISRAMLEVYNNYDNYLKNSQKMREWVRDNYHYDNVKELYFSVIKPKDIRLGEENLVTKEYLQTNSQDLYNKYKENIIN